MAAPGSAPPRFGVEEEFLLLDATDGRPRDRVDELIAELTAVRAEHEYFHCQIETATPVCEHAEEALEALQGFRYAAGAAARTRGLVLSGTGLPPLGGECSGTPVQSERYQQIAEQMRGMVRRYYSTGTHVHVEVPSRDAGIEVIARLAPWSPVMVALTANSPLWLGEDSGFASWRFLQLQQWPSSGYPPAFADSADYDRVVEGLVEIGALVDSALVNWFVRLSEKYPTIELRTADSQLRGEDAVAYGLLLRALVHRALDDLADGVPAPHTQPDALRGAHWIAARNGVGSDLVDPRTARLTSASEVTAALLEHVEPQLRIAGDLDRVTTWVERQVGTGGSAALQRETWNAGGVTGLMNLYASGSQVPGDPGA